MLEVFKYYFHLTGQETKSQLRSHSYAMIDLEVESLVIACKAPVREAIKVTAECVAGDCLCSNLVLLITTLRNWASSLVSIF